MDSLLAWIAAWRYLSWRKALLSWFHVLGGLALLIEIEQFFFPDVATGTRAYSVHLLILAGLVGLCLARPRTRISAKVQGTDVIVSICVVNLLSQRGALVVGTNTTFDTSIEDGTISGHNVQGQVTRRLCGSHEQLDREIDAALREVPFVERTREDKPYGKRLSYQVGTVARIRCTDGRLSYFVAIATLNKTRTAQSTRQNVQDALPRLWEHIRENGEIGPLATPVLGSGFARVRASRQELVMDMVRSFVAANRSGKFCEELTIALAPKDFLGGKYDLRELSRFLEYECEYSSATASFPDPPVGTPL